MEEEHLVREYQPGDEKGIVDLLTSVFNSWPRFDLLYSTLDYWNWLFRKNPLNRENTIVVAITKNDDIIGCNHGTTLALRVNSQRLVAQIAGSLAVHIDHRKKGVSRKMLAVKRKIHDRNKIDMTYQFTTNPIVIESSLRRDRPTFPCQIYRMIKIFDINLHNEMNTKIAWWKRYGYKTLLEIEKLRSTYRTHQVQLEKNLKINEIEEFDPRINIFWEEIKDYYSFIVERTMDYLNWRYNDKKAGSYIVIQAEEEERVIGYSVLRVNKIRKNYLSGYLKGHPNENILLENGFFRRKEKFYVSLNTMSEVSIKQVEAIKNAPADRLHLQYGDSDII
jgi:hypothetical protein